MSSEDQQIYMISQFEMPALPFEIGLRHCRYVRMMRAERAGFWSGLQIFPGAVVSPIK